MAALGVRETLTPSADRRKRRRKDQGPESEEALASSPSTARAPADGNNCSAPKQKKTRVETRSSLLKAEAAAAAAAAAAAPEAEKTSIKAKSEPDAQPEEDEPVSIKSPSAKEADGQEWKPEDRLILLDQIQVALPSDDNAKYSTMADKLCWDKVKVGEYSAEECKEEWLRISTKLRRFRTMSELLRDAKEWMKHPWNAFGKKTTKHPGMPKKPLTPYFRFFMAKRQKYAEKNPKMGVTDLTKELSKKYANLSERKKKKYVDAYNKEMEEWKAAMVLFRKHHPEAFDDEEKSGSVSVKQPFQTAPPKSTSAMQLYITEKYSEEKNPDVSRKQLYEKFKSQWFALSDNKKLKYIKLAIEAKEKYDVAVVKFQKEHPDYQPRPVKSFLSKAEQKIKDRFDGKPEKPPVNGYSLFTVETLPLLTDMPNIERLGEVSRRWKKLSEDKREAYNLKADERNQEYRIKYEKYLQSLPEEERRKLEEEENDKKKKQPPNSTTSPSNSIAAVERPQKPVAAVFIFINDKKDEYRKKYPHMDDNELQRLLVKEYNCLNEKDKVKYKKLEEEEKQKLAQDSVPPPASSSKKVKRISFPGEPPKPPHSGYQLFSKELLTQLKDFKSNERLQEIGRRWIALPDEEKKQHNRRKDLMWVQYRKDLEKFKKSLSPKDRKQYEEMNTTSKKKKAAKKTTQQDEEESSSEEEEDDDGDEAENGEASSSDAEESSASESEANEENASGSSTSESESGDEESDSDEEEEDSSQAKKLADEKSNNTQTQGKLRAKDVYDSSNESSSDNSESEESSSAST